MAIRNELAHMGMDLVEIVIRVEETFAIDLPNEECSYIRTVGDLYHLTLEKLHLPYQSAMDLDAARPGRDFSELRFPGLTDWTTPDVWATLRGIVVDQLQVNMEEVREGSSFLNDLGCD